MIESTVQIRFYLLHTLFLVLDDVSHPDAASYKSQSDDALDKLPKEIKQIKENALTVNKELQGLWGKCGVTLVDFKLEFGRLADGTIVLADEISPDTCRLWDSATKEKLDKDRFRRDLGGVEDAYRTIMGRLEQYMEQQK